MVSKNAQGVKGEGNYGVLASKLNNIIYDSRNLSDVYLFCGCLSGSVQSTLLIVELDTGLVVDQLKLSNRKEVC